MNIGIFGGTFDPFTPGHKAIVDAALKQLDKVIILPTVVSWHRAEKDCWLKSWQKVTLINDIYGHEAEIVIGDEYAQKMIEESEARVIIDQHEFDWALANLALVKNRRYVHMFSDETLRYGLRHEYQTIIGSDSYMQLGSWWKSEAVQTLGKLMVVEGRGNSEVKNILYAYALGTTFIQIDKKFAETSATKMREIYSKLPDGYTKYVEDFKAQRL